MQIRQSLSQFEQAMPQNLQQFNFSEPRFPHLFIWEETEVGGRDGEERNLIFNEF